MIAYRFRCIAAAYCPASLWYVAVPSVCRIDNHHWVFLSPDLEARFNALVEPRSVGLLVPASATESEKREREAEFNREYERVIEIGYLEQYKLGRNAKSVLALCLSEAGETFHHWKVFTQGSDGVCIQFHRVVLLNAVNVLENLLHGPSEYIEINKAKTPTLERLPFLKRFPYRDEKEFRLVYFDLGHEIDFKCIPIPLDAIERITTSPWLPENLRGVVRDTICSVAGSAVQVSNTTLLDNERWKNLGRLCCAALDGEVTLCVRS